MLVRVLYKPPPCHLPSFLLMFGQFLANMLFDAMPVIVNGDFIVDLLCDNNRKAELLAFMSDRGFAQYACIVTSATHRGGGRSS